MALGWADLLRHPVQHLREVRIKMLKYNKIPVVKNLQLRARQKLKHIECYRYTRKERGVK